jgi:hypothetical protein
MRSHVLATQLPTSLKHVVNSVYCHNNLWLDSSDIAHGLKCGRDHGAVVDMAELLRVPLPTAYRSAHCHSSSNCGLDLPCLRRRCSRSSMRGKMRWGRAIPFRSRVIWSCLNSLSLWAGAEHAASPTLQMDRQHPLRECAAPDLRKSTCQ